MITPPDSQINSDAHDPHHVETTPGVADEPTDSFSPAHQLNGDGHALDTAASNAHKRASAPPPAEGPLDKPNPTDLGNARRVVDRHGGDLGYCHPMKAYFCWDGRRWAYDQTGEAMRRVKETAVSLGQWAAQRIAELGDVGDDEAKHAEKARLVKTLTHALKWEDARRLSACLELIKSERGIPI